MDTKEYIITAFTENQVGVLNRITAIYLRRKINIESLRVSETNNKGVSMFVINAITTRETIDKIAEQIRRIIEVFEVRIYLPEQLVARNISLCKISKESLDDKEINDIITHNKNARIVEVCDTFVVVEITGSKDEILYFRSQLSKENHLIQFAISGSVIIHKKPIDLDKFLK